MFKEDDDDDSVFGAFVACVNFEITTYKSKYDAATSGFEMFFCYRIPAPLVPGPNSPKHTKHVSNPDSVMTAFKQPFNAY